MTEKWNEKAKISALAVISLLAVLLRFFRLGHQSFWIDEILTVGSYGSPGGGVSYGVKLLWDVHGPLYSLLLHFWSMVSSSEAWLRAPGAAAGVGTVILTYFWLRREADERTAFTAALMMAVSPFNVYYSQELRFYSLLTMLLVLSLLVFSFFKEKPTFRSGVVLGMVLGLACLAHLMAIFLCLGLAAYMAVTGRLKGAHLKFGLLAAAIATAVVSPWIYRQIFFITKIRSVEESLRPEIQRLENTGSSTLISYAYIMFAFAVGFSYGPDLRELHEASGVSSVLAGYWPQIAAAAALFTAASAIGIVRLLRERRAALFLSIPAVTILMVTVAALSRFKVMNARYAVCAFPIFIAIIARGAASGKRIGYAMTAALTVMMAYSVFNYHFVPRFARDDFRAAIGVVNSSDADGDVIFAPGMEPIVRYYYKGACPVEALYVQDLNRDSAEEGIERISDGYRRIWFVSSRPWDTDPDGYQSSYLENNLTLEAEWDFTGVSLRLFEMPPGTR